MPSHDSALLLPSDDEGPPPSDIMGSGVRKRPAAADSAAVAKRPAANTPGPATKKLKTSASDADKTSKHSKKDKKPDKKEDSAIEENKVKMAVFNPPGAPMLAVPGQRVLLELFAGTGSIGKAFAKRGWQVYSLDIDKKAFSGPGPFIHEDILKFDIKRYFHPGFFSVVWASPPCTEYSMARTTAKQPRNLEGADKLVSKALKIVKTMAPRFFFLENPQSGLLKSRPVVEGLGVGFPSSSPQH
jgi:hypothetical protein